MSDATKVSIRAVPDAAQLPQDKRNDDASVTSQIVAFATGLQFDDVPAAVVATLKRHLLDTIGCAAAGAHLDVSRAAVAAGAAMEGKDGAEHVIEKKPRAGSKQAGCHVFGSATQFGPATATFINATMTNALDFDDGVEINGKGLGHPSASLVAAALAALDRYDCNGRDLLCALAAGYEINNRLIASIQPSARRFEQVYGIGQHQSLGACIVYGLLAGLSEECLHGALGLAGALTGLPSLHKYNWQSRPIVSFKDGVGPAALAGVNAVLLAKAGFVGSRDILDGPQGLWRMLGSDRFASDLLCDGLGERWWTTFGSIKLFPACRWLAPALEAFETLRERHSLLADDIERIEVKTFGKVARDLMGVRPTNAIDAQFSLPYLLSVLANRVPPGLHWFDETQLRSTANHAIAERVVVLTDPEMDALMHGRRRRPSATVSVHLASGDSFTVHVASPLGSIARPVSDETVRAKAHRNLHDAGLNAAAIIDFVAVLDQYDAPVRTWHLMRST